MNIISMYKISKYFSVNNVQALNRMNLTVKQGEIHAIVGENGAGKSTLMKILHGVETKDSGELTILGNTGMVSQHFRLIDELSITENIIIGSEPTKFRYFLDKKRSKNSILDIFSHYGFHLDLGKKIADLSIGQKQLIEIIKVIYNDAEILILDEPTAALSDPETEKLRDTLLSLKRNGKTIIIISHKIKDISTISDRFTIMRNGSFIETVKTSCVDIKDISKLMSGTQIIETILDTTNKIGKKLFSFNYMGKDIDLHSNEIIGITGYGGCGLHKLEDMLEQICLTNPDMGYAPSDRLIKGVEIDSLLKETLIANSRKDFTRYGFLMTREIDKFATSLIDKYSIKGSINSRTGTLSGGNLQKSVIARELNKKPKILVLSSPTWGIDIESSNSLYTQLKEYKQNGHGIILLSFDAEEILKLSNKIFVMYKGRIIEKINNNGTISTHDIGKLSSGILDG